MLIEKLGAEDVSVGENFRFGKGAKGDAGYWPAGEFETRVAPLVEVAGETVSSSQIRALVAAGEVEKAAEFLGGPFLLEGMVVEATSAAGSWGCPPPTSFPTTACGTRPRRLRGVGARLSALR